MFRLSLSGLLILVAAIALAIVSLRYASSMWQALVGMLCLLASFAAVIVAVFDHGPRRVFAVGFVICALGYVALVLNGHKAKNGSLIIPVDLVAANWDYALPTTVLLRDLHKRVSHTIWLDEQTGKEVSAEEGAKFQAAVSAGSISGMRSLTTTTRPSGDDLVVIGHCWLSLLFGYLGGSFARFVYLRRERERASSAVPKSQASANLTDRPSPT